MKKEIKGFVIGVIASSIILGGSAFADSFTKTIEVAFNKVNLKVNGTKVEADNILYNGTTYVPLRKVADILGKETGWDTASNTASINDKGTLNTLPTDQTQFNNLSEYKTTINIDDNNYEIGFPIFIRTDKNKHFYTMYGSSIAVLISIYFKDYTIEPTDNPYFKGIIKISDKFNNYFKYSSGYSSPNTPYNTATFYNKDKSKEYKYSNNINDSVNAYLDKQDKTYLVQLDDVFSKLGINASIEQDDTNKLIIIKYK